MLKSRQCGLVNDFQFVSDSVPKYNQRHATRFCYRHSDRIVFRGSPATRICRRVFLHRSLVCTVGKAGRRYTGVTHIDVATLDEAKAAEINALCEKHGVSISGLGYYRNPLVKNETEASTYIEHIKKVISGAQLLGLTNMNTFIDRNTRSPSPTTGNFSTSAGLTSSSMQSHAT
tara:strand:+ start:3676 stop:4197 length:522 start_codon:yes stop_codon:yes gene_type:complete